MEISPSGDTVLLHQKKMLGDAMNEIGEFNWRHTISAFDSVTGEEKEIWSKDKLLGLSDNGILLASSQK